MKKKLMMVAVLLGALSLGACVDDNESQSVTDLRGAKAAQLEALANLYNAQAAAEAAAAEAEAQLQAAYAAYWNAKAAAENAETAYQQQLLEQAQQKFQYKLAALQAEWEAKVAEYNSLKKYYENELWGHEDAHTQKVYGAYAGALAQVNSLTQTKFEQQVLKAQTEAQTITAEESLKQSIADLNTERAQKVRELNTLTEMKEMQPSKDEYLTMLDNIEKEAYDILNNKRPDAKVKSDNAKETFSNALETTEDGTYKFIEAANIINDFVTEYVSGVAFTTSENVELAEEERDAFYEKWQDNVEDNSEFTFTKEIVAVNSQFQNAKLMLDRAFEDALSNKDNEIEAKTGTAWQKDPQGNITWDVDYDINNEDELTVNAEKSIQAYYDQQIAAANKRVEEWTAEMNKEGVSATDKEQYEQWIENETGKGGNIEYYTKEKENSAIRQMKAEEAVDALEAEKKEIEADQKLYNETLPILSDAAAQKEYEDAVAKLEEPAVAYVAAQDELKPFDVQLEDLGFVTSTTNGNPEPDYSNTDGQYQYIKGLLDGIYDVQDEIDNCNTRIAEIDAILSTSGLGQLVELVTYYTTAYNPVTGNYENVTIDYYQFVVSGAGITLENALALIDTRIAQLDEQIKIQQALADKYQAELEAYLNLQEEEDAPVEEQPAA